MIALQYSFVLPADYDMGIIDRRVADNGHAFDDFGGLKFKAFLTAYKRGGQPENIYAPFYVWEDTEGLNNFVFGDKFHRLTNAFGWPSIKTWIVTGSRMSLDIGAASLATKETTPISPFESLDQLRIRENEAVESDLRNGALASVSAFEPTSWTRIRFCLWRDAENASRPKDAQAYRVLHVSAPGLGN